MQFFLCASLSFKEADERLKKVGLNFPVGSLYSPWWELLWNAFWHPFNIILFVLSALCFVAGDKANGSIMVVMVILSVSLRFYQVINLRLNENGDS
jgi:Mg2+-importing ATPase